MSTIVDKGFFSPINQAASHTLLFKSYLKVVAGAKTVRMLACCEGSRRLVVSHIAGTQRDNRDAFYSIGWGYNDLGFEIGSASCGTRREMITVCRMQYVAGILSSQTI